MSTLNNLNWDISKQRNNTEFEQHINNSKTKVSTIMDYTDFIFSLFNQTNLDEINPINFITKTYKKYWFYDFQELIKNIENIENTPELAYKYFEKYWDKIEFSEISNKLKTLKHTLINIQNTLNWYLEIAVFIFNKLDLKQDDDELNYEININFPETNLDNTLKFLDNLKNNPELSESILKLHWIKQSKDEIQEKIEKVRYYLIYNIDNIKIAQIKDISNKSINETDTQKRKKLVQILKEKLEKLLTENQYFLDGHRREGIPITMDLIYQIDKETDVYRYDEKRVIAHVYWLDTASINLQIAEFLNDFDETIWIIDKKKLEEKTKIYWAKWANLDMIKEFLEKLNLLREKTKLPFYYEIKELNIPAYEKIPVSIHKKWKNNENIDKELKTYFNQIKGKKVILRSSALYSEDNENSTWAWIYESITLKENASFEEFKNEIIKIYESTNSEKAIKYQKDNKINKEEMWIIIQEYIDEHHKNEKIYINTILKNVPELMDIVFEYKQYELEMWENQDESKLRPIINKNKLIEKITDPNSNERNSFHYQLDSKRVWSYSLFDQIEEIWIICYLLEKHYNKAIQIETILDLYDEPILHILQSRYLPENYSQKSDITFPKNKNSLFRWRSLWAVDTTLDILPNWKNNSNEKWCVIFDWSQFCSLGINNFDESMLPKDWVVIVTWASNHFRWHIETICAEKWITIIFSWHKLTLMEQKNRADLIWRGQWQEKRFIDNFYWEKKLYIVSNWIEWRVYRSDNYVKSKID